MSQLITNPLLTMVLGAGLAVGGRLVYDFLIAGRAYVTKEECMKGQDHCSAKLEIDQLRTTVTENAKITKDTIQVINEIRTTTAVHTTILQNIEKRLDERWER